MRHSTEKSTVCKYIIKIRGFPFKWIFMCGQIMRMEANNADRKP
jgi:hypothetical protein